MGEAGIGKSRLAKEFVESIGSKAKVITGRCPAYGEGITFLPLRQAVLEAAGPSGWPAITEHLAAEDDGAQVAGEIAAGIGLTPGAGNVSALFAAVRRLFQTLADEHPLVVVFEDLHWAEPTFLDLIDYLAGRGRSRVCVVSGSARAAGTAAGLADARHPVPGGAVPRQRSRSCSSIGPGAVPPETFKRIVITAQGDPLFAEQLLAAFDDAPFDAVPASLHGLLTMRLDRLGPGARDMLRCAAVIGAEFRPGSTLVALLPDQARRFADRHLDRLDAGSCWHR